MLVFRIYFATKHQESDKKKISDTLNNEELNDDNDLKNEAI